MALPAAAGAVSAAAAGGGAGALLRRVRAADSRAVPADRRENRLFVRLLGEAAAALFGLRLSACRALHGYRHRRGEAAFLHGVRKAAALLRLRPAVPRRAAAGRAHALRQLPGDGGHRSGRGRKALPRSRKRGCRAARFARLRPDRIRPLRPRHPEPRAGNRARRQV